MRVLIHAAIAFSVALMPIGDADAEAAPGVAGRFGITDGHPRLRVLEHIEVVGRIPRIGRLRLAGLPAVTVLGVILALVV